MNLNQLKDRLSAIDAKLQNNGNKLYQACTYHMSNWTRSKIVELRRELQSVNIYVQRLKVERGAIIVPYKSRYIAGSLTIEPDDAERQIKILIGDYSQLVFGRRPD